jgi:hypothetical protein
MKPEKFTIACMLRASTIDCNSRRGVLRTRFSRLRRFDEVALAGSVLADQDVERAELDGLVLKGQKVAESDGPQQHFTIVSAHKKSRDALSDAAAFLPLF